MRIRRTSLTIALLASTALSLGACDNTPEQPKTETVNQEEILFKNVDECKAGGQFDADQCEALAKNAQEEHAKTAPKFNSREACEAEYGAGKCGGVQNQQGGSSGSQMSYTPILAGFLIGAAGAMAAAHVVNGMNRNNTPAYQPRPRPVYETTLRDRRPGQTSYASGGTTVGTMMQNGRVQTQVTRPAPPSSGGGFWNNRQTPTSPSSGSGVNSNARTPVSPTGPRIQQTAPAAPAVAPKPSWSAPKVTPTSPTMSAPTSRPFGGSSRPSSSGFSGGRGGGGGFS
jgi:uncharacterized protein YgiB involved in biofilm formation